jgi:hypothetical protein
VICPSLFPMSGCLVLRLGFLISDIMILVVSIMLFHLQSAYVRLHMIYLFIPRVLIGC